MQVQERLGKIQLCISEIESPKVSNIEKSKAEPYQVKLRVVFWVDKLDTLVSSNKKILYISK